MNYLEKDKLYCSQGDTSGKHKPKKYLLEQKTVIYLMNAALNILICKCIIVLQISVIRTKHTVNV